MIHQELNKNKMESGRRLANLDLDSRANVEEYKEHQKNSAESGTYHSSLKKYICLNCNEAYENESSLIEHIKEYFSNVT